MVDLKKYNEESSGELSFEAGVIFEDYQFEGIDLTQKNLRSVSFLNCQFVRCNLANQALTNTSFKEALFDSCNLIGINWCSAKALDLLKFHNSKLNLSSFQGLKLKRTEIINCSAIDVDFSETDLSSSDFSQTNFSQANLNGADLRSCDFRSSQNYIFDLRVAKIKGAKFSTPHVLSLLTVLGIEIN